MALKKWNTNFRLEHPDRKNRTSFSDVSLLSETDFPQKRPQKACSIYFRTKLSGNSLQMVNNLCLS